MQPRILLVFRAACSQCWLVSHFSSTRIPKAFPIEKEVPGPPVPRVLLCSVTDTLFGSIWAGGARPCKPTLCRTPCVPPRPWGLQAAPVPPTTSVASLVRGAKSSHRQHRPPCPVLRPGTHSEPSTEATGPAARSALARGEPGGTRPRSRPLSGPAAALQARPLPAPAAASSGPCSLRSEGRTTLPITAAALAGSRPGEGRGVPRPRPRAMAGRPRPGGERGQAGGRRGAGLRWWPRDCCSGLGGLDYSEVPGAGRGGYRGGRRGVCCCLCPSPSHPAALLRVAPGGVSPKVGVLGLCAVSRC